MEQQQQQMTSHENYELLPPYQYFVVGTNEINMINDANINYDYQRVIITTDNHINKNQNTKKEESIFVRSDDLDDNPIDNVVDDDNNKKNTLGLTKGDMTLLIAFMFGFLFGFVGIFFVFCFTKKRSYLIGWAGSMIWILGLTIFFSFLSYYRSDDDTSEKHEKFFVLTALEWLLFYKNCQITAKT